MAGLLRVQIAILYGLLALSVAATARPCRTFFVSLSFPADSSTVTTFTEIRSFIPAVKPSLAAEIFADRVRAVEIERRKSPVRESVRFSAYDLSSLRDRTKDILSVVVALLFGVGCGAITAATMYLVWSVVSCRIDYRASYDDVGEEEEKTGYAKISSKEASV